jgi:diguanylate cyclase (GGDEF)-like protein/excisionase family DNA binding protein
MNAGEVGAASPVRVDLNESRPSPSGGAPGADGVPSRGEFETLLSRALERQEEEGVQTAVLMIDVNGIARINRALGHGAGDEVLDNLGRQLRRVVGPEAKLARFTGERFVVLCERLAGEVEAVQLGNKVVDAVRASRLVGDLRVRLTVNVGVAIVPPAHASVEAVLRDVDSATQQAGWRGPNRVEVFRPETRRQIVRQLKLEAELYAAFERDELGVHFQPIVSLRDQRLVAIEALIRWHHPSRGLVPPDRFIPAAEESGLIMDIGDWMLAEICDRLARWKEREDSSWECPPVSINVSPRQLCEGTFGDRLSTALLATGVSPSSIMLEITESSAMELQRGSLEMLAELKRIGVMILLDDFGAGYSSLAWLSRLPIDGFKVDRAFIGHVSTLTDPAPILAAVVEMGRALGLTIIAEGVETPEQLAVVRAVGVDAVQGYFVARPAPAESISQLRQIVDAALSASAEIAIAPPRDSEHDELIRLGTAADLLGVSASTVRRLADQGALPSIRTGGGHRRFHRRALERFAQQRLGEPALAPRKLPAEPLLHAARLLRDGGPQLIDRVRRAMYEGSRGGWFATPQARTRASLWLESFSATLAQGHYRDAIEVTTSYLERAVLAGASVTECVRFLGQFAQVAGRDILRSGSGGAEEARAVQRLTNAAMESFLERLDR